MGLFAFPLREGSPEVNAWAIPLRVWRRRSRWRMLISVAVMIGALAVIFHLMPGRAMRGAVIGLGAGLLGGILGVSLGGLGFILRTRLFLDSAVTPLTTRDLVVAAQRLVLPPMVAVSFLIVGVMVVGGFLSQAELRDAPYVRMLIRNEPESWVRADQIQRAMDSGPPYQFDVDLMVMEGEPGLALQSHRLAFMASLAPLGVAGLWFLLGLLAFFALWEKTVPPAKSILALLIGWLGSSVIIGFGIVAVHFTIGGSFFPMGPAPPRFQSAAEFWPRTTLLCAAALGVALLLWSLGNATWRRAACLPLDRIHETMQARLGRRARGNT